MNIGEETDKNKKSRKEIVSNEFSRIVDSTSEFVKSIFPFIYTFVKKIRNKKDK